MSKRKESILGDLAPKYSFILNPYPTQRLTRCPFCEGKTGQRKIPLTIHVDPQQLIALNYTCRYCHACDLLIAHKHEIEHLLYNLFSLNNPEAIGNDYLIFGTMEKKAWRKGIKESKPVDEMLAYVSDFETYYQELRLTQPGWYGPKQKPRIMKPAPSQEWVKAKS
jgi:hypothetical protein